MTEYVKYPRTPHLPWSKGTDDDIVLTEDFLVGKEVVVTEKMDGENTTMYRDHIHARSTDSGYHPSRTWVKGFHSQIAYMIPEDFRIVGENMYATHSLKYTQLPSYFVGISLWVRDVCIGWDVTLQWFDKLGITPVPEIARGIWPLDIKVDETAQEGYVVRNIGPFKQEDFAKNVAKYVRPQHVQTDDHWMHGEMLINELGG